MIMNKKKLKAMSSRGRFESFCGLRVRAWLAACLLLCGMAPVRAGEMVTFKSLLQEMVDRDRIASWPKLEYRSLQASSYNRASKTPDNPAGWFANGDCNFEIRKEDVDGRTECVLMEHEGPGVLTRIWTPFFQDNMHSRVGTDIRIYIDGEKTPRIQGSMINLVTGKLMVKPPFAQTTLRAGVMYLPIPFKKSCKITREKSSFFYIINYRAYAPGTEVESFSPDMLTKESALLDKVGGELVAPANFTTGTSVGFDKSIVPGCSETVALPAGSAAIRHIEFKLEAASLPVALRSTVLEMIFDGKQTVWCPIGDFFSNVNGMDPPHKMWERDTLPDGSMICRWVMPYKTSASVILHNLAKAPVQVHCRVVTSPRTWTPDSLYFHTQWWTHDPYAARPVFDMNFIDVQGRGIHVGDTLVVLQSEWSWWGEGDEKIFVDEDVERRFPSHWGTGSEDYYGWAGGEVPTRKDEFSAPFVANVRVGGEPWQGREYTHGYNICTRTRSLDATPFSKRFKFDMEAFNMCGGPKDWLQYSLITHWYGDAGTTHNRPPMPEAAAVPVPQADDVIKFRDAIFAKAFADRKTCFIENAVEVEAVNEVEYSPGVKGAKKKTDDPYSTSRFSADGILLVDSAKQGDFATFTFTEQYKEKRMILYMVQADNFGTLNFYVNGEPVKTVKDWDGYGGALAPSRAIDLGLVKPDGNVIRLKVEVTGKNQRSKGFQFGLDAVQLKEGMSPLPAADSISLSSLLNEMVDRNRIAVWPDPEYKSALTGSHDRASKTPDDPKGWFANGDYSDGIGKYMTCITNDDRREWVLMDVDGPGCITRFWTGGKPADGNIRFYLDGAKEPVITARMQDLFCGRGFVPKPLAIENPKDAGNLYLPIPYASHCTVTYDEKNKNPGKPPSSRWWNVEYRTYSSGAKVKTFTMEDFKTAEPLISMTCKALLEQNTGVEGKTSSLDKIIEPGKEVFLDLPSGSAAVCSVELSVGSDQTNRVAQALRSTVLSMSFDGVETVWCPVGDFFGSGRGPELAPVSSWYRSVDKSGKLSCRWVMPYRTSARASLLNLGDISVSLKMAVVTGTWKWTDKSMYFHSNWHQQRDIPTRPFSDWNYLTAKGKGLYLGDTMTIFNPSDKWWGEGDEKIWVDNGSFPTHFGTGSEDYYGYAWGCPIRFQGPFCNQPYIQRGNAGYTVNTRTRSLDAIPFVESLKFDMEIWHWQDCKVDYAVATYWYALPGATCNRGIEPEEVKTALRVLAPEAKEPVSAAPAMPGAIECEAMKILVSSENLDISRQSNIQLPKGHWSSGSQLFVKAKKEGDFVELLVCENVDGPRKVVLHATKSYDYGILRFTVNGKPVGNDFDGYAEKSDLSGPVELGVFEPRDGRIILRIEVVGANTASRGSRYFFGLDCITLNKL